MIRDPLPRADAIVMLSGSATFRERADKAAELYHQGRSQTIILTNDNLQGEWSSPQQRNPYYYERAMEELRRVGVPQEKIQILVTPVYGTYDEAILLRQYADTHGLRSLLLVTSAYHSRRALWTFRRVFSGNGATIGLESVETGIQTPSPATWWFHTRGWKMVAGEYLKFVYYRFHYA
jgi:uncharacterized SAM-binding protein YcdF (DUF218 family)